MSLPLHRRLTCALTSGLLGLLVALPGSALGQSGGSVPNFGDGIEFGDPGATMGAPNVYVVQPGDTLWEISSRFLGNPYYWPRLWSINEYITNPHWIYPGNRIVFRMGTLIDGPQIDIGDGVPRVDAVDIITDNADCGPDIRFDQTRPARIYTANSFMAGKGEVDIYGTVEKARGQQTYLSERDLVYLKVDDPEAYSCGDVVSIFRRAKKMVRHPERRSQRFGSRYLVVGEAKVVHRHGDYLAAVVRNSWQEIQRGDLVGAPIPVNIEMEVGEPRGDLEGVIVDRSLDERFMLGPNEVVFIDRGRADGVRVGHAFYVVEQRDEHVDIEEEDKDLPFAVIGRLVVVRVDEYSATAVITDSDRDFKVGTRIRQTLDERN